MLTRGSVDTLRKQAERLLSHQISLIEVLSKVENLIVSGRDDREKQSFTSESALEDIEVLEDEIRKLEQLHLVVAVVGTMKAGKSTTINAIVGTEVLPARNRPMTAVPTLIRHKARTSRYACPVRATDHRRRLCCSPSRRHTCLRVVV